MVINAYKTELLEDKTVTERVKPIDDVTIAKEIVERLINGEKVLIEKGKIMLLSSIIKKMLIEDYSIGDSAKIQEIKQTILDRIFGYGIIQKYLKKEDVTDIRMISYDRIYIKQKGVWKLIEEKFKNVQEFEEYVRFCALKNNATINFETPIVTFSDRKNSLRIEAGIEPVNIMGPNLVIRIHRKNQNINLEKLFVEYEMLDKQAYKILCNEINFDDNIILCGKGGSGKTTLLRALIKRLPENIAITSNEETAELYLEGRNIIQRECILNRRNDKNVDLEQLSRHSLVMSNDMIIIGELKGAEANSFFDSISTGHIGLATVHSDSSKNAIDRIITLIKKDIKAQYYTESFLRRLLSNSIDYIMFLENFKIMEIAKVKYNENKQSLEIVYIYTRGQIKCRQ